jgi:hypothetical protein
VSSFTHLTHKRVCHIDTNPHMHFVLSPFSLLPDKGRAIAKAVVADFSPRRPRSGHVKFLVDKTAVGRVFSECFGSPFQSQSFYRLFHIHHHPWSWADTTGQTVIDVSSGFCLTFPQETTSKQEVKGKGRTNRTWKMLCPTILVLLYISSLPG